MEEFRLSNNKLTGKLDFDGLMGSKSTNHGLTHLYLDNNKFTGQLPQSLSKMKNLQKSVRELNTHQHPLPLPIVQTEVLEAKPL